jgi:replication factor A1
MPSSANLVKKMTLEEIVEQILSSRSDLKRKEVLEMIQKKKSEAGDFLTDETAARIVASELGVESRKKPLSLEIKIQDLVSGLGDVTVTGKIVALYPPKVFTRRDMTEGKLASILVSDSNGTLRVVLWDDKVDLVEKGKIQHKQTIRISHGYMREGWGRKLDMHVGKRGVIEVLETSEK